MEDIRLAASLFFKQNPQSKNIALTEFSTLTQTKPGCVTKKAFDEHLRQRLPGCSSSNLAAELNDDCDSYLTFEYLLVYHYLFQTRPVCGHCKAIVKLVFYTCLQCFADELKPPTYDLFPRCYLCYLGNKFSHAHNLLVSNNAMVNNVRSRRRIFRLGKGGDDSGSCFASNALGKQVIDAFLPGSGI